MPPKRKKAPQTTRIFGLQIDTDDPGAVRRHIAGIFALSCAVKILVVIMTIGIFSSFVDFFDISLYHGYAAQILAGKIPFLDFSIEYPVLFLIPVILPVIVTLGAANPLLYAYAYMGIMAVFDALIAVAVYLIALRYHSEKGAWVCGVLSATAFSAAYFAITKYDAFPTLLLMGGILFVLYGSKGLGYAAIALGFLAKIFPLLALPPALFHASAATSVRTEVVRAVKICLPIVAILALPALLLDPSAYRTYLFAAGAGAGLYVNTPTNTLTLLLHDVLHLPVGPDAVSLVMYLCMAAGFVILLALTVSGKKGDPRRLLELVLLLLFTAVFFSRFHSPQYILWLTPFLALLLAGSVRSILLFYLVQALVFIEFPLSFGVLWVNLSYVAPPLTAGWYTALLLFVLKWTVLAAAVYSAVVIDPDLAGDMRAIPARLRSLSSGRTPA